MSSICFYVILLNILVCTRIYLVAISSQLLIAFSKVKFLFVKLEFENNKYTNTTIQSSSIKKTVVRWDFVS